MLTDFHELHIPVSERSGQEFDKATHAGGYVRKWLVVLEAKAIKVLEQVKDNLPRLSSIREGSLKLDSCSFQLGVEKRFLIETIVVQPFGKLTQDLRTKVFGNISLFIHLPESSRNFVSLSSSNR